MKNILFASSSVTPTGGGIPAYAYELIKALSGEYNIYVLTDEKNPIKYDNDIVSMFSTYGNDSFSYEYGNKVLKFIENNRIDLVINSNSTIIAVLAPFIKAPIISISHFTDGPLALVAGFNARFVNHIVALSKSAKKYLERRYKIIDENKVVVIYNFIHNNNPVLGKQNQSPIVIVYPGGCSPHKSPELVYLAVKRLLKSNLPFKFFWIGNTTVPLKELSFKKNLRDFFKSDDRLVFTGRISRKESLEIIGKCNIFLLPFRGEGCAMTLLEALTGGCIPIVSDHPHASKEILNDGKFGVVINDVNDKKIAETIEDIIINHSNYFSSYTDSINYVKENLSKEHWIEKMRLLINEALRESKEVIPLNCESHLDSVKNFKRRFRVENFHEKKTRFGCYWRLLFYSIIEKFSI